MRWIVAQKNRVRNGELYRFIADSKGAFVQVRGGGTAAHLFAVPSCQQLADGAKQVAPAFRRSLVSTIAQLIPICDASEGGILFDVTLWPFVLIYVLPFPPPPPAPCPLPPCSPRCMRHSA
jgi:hypothetical protein